MQPVVTLLTTGGTVATMLLPGGRSASTLSDADLAAMIELPGVTLRAHELRRQPSWTFGPVDMASIALAARDAARATAAGGVVVTHGTTTLEYTAFLAELVLDVDAPVVFTGAMRRADDLEPDGPGNLRDAVRVAAAPAARGLGALVVFAGRVMSARGVWKAQRSAVDAFVDRAGDLGRVTETGFELERIVRRASAFSGRLEERIAYVKAMPGDDGRIVDAALERGSLGLVIEALPGVGGIPPGMHASLAAAAPTVPVVVASRAPFGRMPGVPAGGTGEPLRDLDILSAGTLTGEQAWLLLMVVLGDAGEDPEAVRDRFRAAVSERDDSTAGGGQGG